MKGKEENSTDEEDEDAGDKKNKENIFGDDCSEKKDTDGDASASDGNDHTNNASDEDNKQNSEELNPNNEKMLSSNDSRDEESNDLSSEEAKESVAESKDQINLAAFNSFLKITDDA